MKQANVKSKEVEAENEKLLAEIFELDKEISMMNATVRRKKAILENLLYQAQDREITKAGRFELIHKTTKTQIVDVPALLEHLTVDEVISIAKVTISDASMHLNREALKTCLLTSGNTKLKVVENSRTWEERK